MSVPRQAKPLLLLVDDEAANLQLLRHILQDDYALLFASSAAARVLFNTFSVAGLVTLISVLLGFPHVHYLMLPWQDGLYSPDDWQGFARATFLQDAGVDPAQCQVQIASAPFGAARLAVATPLELLRALRLLFRAQHLPLGACLPLLTATAQRYWQQLPADGVLAVPEASALSCLYLHGGEATQACALRVAPGTPLHSSLFAAAVLSAENPAAVVVAGPRPPTASDGHWLGPLPPWMQEDAG